MVKTPIETKITSVSMASCDDLGEHHCTKETKPQTSIYLSIYPPFSVLLQPVIYAQGNGGERRQSKSNYL